MILTISFLRLLFLCTHVLILFTIVIICAQLDVGSLYISSREKELFCQGLSAEQQENFDGAIKIYRRALKCTRQPQIAHVFIGNALARLSQFLEAVKSFSAAIKSSTYGISSGDSGLHSTQSVSEMIEFVALYNR